MPASRMQPTSKPIKPNESTAVRSVPNSRALPTLVVYNDKFFRVRRFVGLYTQKSARVLRLSLRSRCHHNCRENARKPTIVVVGWVVARVGVFEQLRTDEVVLIVLIGRFARAFVLQPIVIDPLHALRLTVGSFLHSNAR